MAACPRWLLYAIATALWIPISSSAFDQQPLTTSAAPKRVAVIGAGAGGSFTAYQLRKHADDAGGIPLNITVFERNPYIGGRSTTVNVFEDPAYPVELGASIFVQVNTNLVNASRDLGLPVRSASHACPREADDSLGIWDGTRFVFKLKNTYNWWNVARLFWRYGVAPLRTQNLVKGVVGKFLRLYDQPFFPLASLSEAAATADLLDATSSPGDAFLQANGISSLFAREIIQASTRVNYGQNLPLIHGLESMVCMATDGAVSVEGGNWQIFNGVLTTAKADVSLNTTVTALARNDDGTVGVTYQSPGHPSEHTTFDEVVIAGPLQYSGISISPPLPQTPDEIPYVKLHVTLFASPYRISPQFFHLSDPSAVPETILTTLSEDLDLGSSRRGVGPAGFWSISTLRTVTRSTFIDGEERRQRHYVYKIFTPERPTAEFVTQILGLAVPNNTSRADENATLLRNSTIGDLPTSDISWFHEKLWNPYPFLYPRVTFEEPALAPGVWYTGGIESFISTMETSALMGRNVASLMFQSWMQDSKEYDSNLRYSWDRVEL